MVLTLLSGDYETLKTGEKIVKLHTGFAHASILTSLFCLKPSQIVQVVDPFFFIWIFEKTYT